MVDIISLVEQNNILSIVDNQAKFRIVGGEFHCMLKYTNKYEIHVKWGKLTCEVNTTNYIYICFSLDVYLGLCSGLNLQMRDADVIMWRSICSYSTNEEPPPLANPSLFAVGILITTICFYSDYTGAQVLKNPSCWPGPHWFTLCVREEPRDWDISSTSPFLVSHSRRILH